MLVKALLAACSSNRAEVGVVTIVTRGRLYLIGQDASGHVVMCSPLCSPSLLVRCEDWREGLPAASDIDKEWKGYCTTNESYK